MCWLVSELERVCDYLIVLSGGQVQVAGEVDTLLRAEHVVLTGPVEAAGALERTQTVVARGEVGRQTTALVRRGGQPWDPVWSAAPVSLQELALTCLRDRLRRPGRDAASAATGRSAQHICRTPGALVDLEGLDPAAAVPLSAQDRDPRHLAGLSADVVAEVVKRRAAGLDPANLAGHSLRTGFVPRRCVAARTRMQSCGRPVTGHRRWSSCTAGRTPHYSATRSPPSDCEDTHP